MCVLIGAVWSGGRLGSQVAESGESKITPFDRKNCAKTPLSLSRALNSPPPLTCGRSLLRPCAPPPERGTARAQPQDTNKNTNSARQLGDTAPSLPMSSPPPTSTTTALLSVVDNCGTYDAPCGYCGRPGDTSVCVGMWAHRLHPETYAALLDAGWRRSGCWLYRPVAEATCCVAHTIRLDARAFRASKAQRRAKTRFEAFLAGGPLPGIGGGATPRAARGASPPFGAPFGGGGAAARRVASGWVPPARCLPRLRRQRGRHAEGPASARRPGQAQGHAHGHGGRRPARGRAAAVARAQARGQRAGHVVVLAEWRWRRGCGRG